ncbi:MAG: ketoacyl-ACP synthase III [Treponema sp.]|jgi:3-oxoacyl-[acyl-carrier-protein] synthase-3|nr:ketoacyl-ACP synthase III [Treponema sp.]
MNNYNIEITGTGRAVPSRRVSNDELAAQIQIDTTDEWIRSHTGIGSRHIAGEETAASDLALEAAKNAVAMAAENSGEKAEEFVASLDFIVLATATSDHLACPSTACIVQNKLGAKKAAAMDITAGCTGFIYALETAAALISLKPERKRALVIGADILTRVTDWTDRGTCVLFGDGAGAVIMEKKEPVSNEKRGLLRSSLSADGSGAGYLYFNRGGSRNPYKIGEVIEKPTHLVMDGKEVYNFAVKAITDTVIKLLEEEGITINDVAWIIPHQANARIVQAAAKRLKIPDEKFFLNIEEYANTSAASIPIALDELNRNGRISRGDIIMFVGFGGGLTFGGNLFVW